MKILLHGSNKWGPSTHWKLLSHEKDEARTLATRWADLVNTMLGEGSQAQKGHPACESVYETRSDQAEPPKGVGECARDDGDRAYFGVMDTAVHILIACIDNCSVS